MYAGVLNKVLYTHDISLISVPQHAWFKGIIFIISNMPAICVTYVSLGFIDTTLDRLIGIASEEAIF